MIESIIMTVIATSFIGYDSDTLNPVYLDFVEAEGLEIGENTICHKGTCADSFFVGNRYGVIPETVKFSYLYYG